ncbi:MAG TPA: CHAT domain-containing protein, partial [Vulgatibacter sp.]
ALAAEDLGLVHTAEAAWAAYLELDRESGWGIEAAQRLERLHTASPRPPDLTDERRVFTEEVLGARTAADLEEILARPGTTALLAALEATGDRLVLAEIEVRRAFKDDDWPRAHVRSTQVKEQVEAAMAGKTDERLLASLERAPEPLIALQALRIQAFDAILRGRPREAMELADRIMERCAALGCPLESGLALSDQGTLLYQSGDYRRADAAFRGALERIPASYEKRRAELLGKQATLSLTIGLVGRAIELSDRAASTLRGSGDKGSLSVVVTNLGSIAHEAGHPAAANACFEEGLRLAREAGRRSTEIFATGGMARLAHEFGNQEEAEVLLQEAMEVAKASGQTITLVSLLATRARLQLDDGKPALARSTADELIELASTLDQQPRRAHGLVLAGEAALALGDREEARALLGDALAIGGSSLAAVEGAIPRALRKADSSRERILLARTQSEDGDPGAAWESLGLGPLRPLDDGECMIAFAPQRDDLLVWSATASGTRFDVGSLAELTPLVEGAGWSPEVALRQVFSEKRCPAHVRRVTVLENEVALAAVGNRSVRLSRPDVAVVIARSASTPWPARRLEGAGLVVHSPNPVISEQLLPPLPGGPKEARLVLQAWPGSLELSGTHATPREVARVAPRFDLLHFGVHAESRTRVGASSYLMLAGEDGYLQVIDVLGLGLTHRRPVVVLSACRGGGKTIEKEKDGAGLPWAFLEAGAQMVIAFRENLDDRAAVDFSAAFYPLVGGGADVSEAFEQALEELRQKWPAEVVASFALYI